MVTGVTRKYATALDDIAEGDRSSASGWARRSAEGAHRCSSATRRLLNPLTGRAGADHAAIGGDGASVRGDAACRPALALHVRQSEDGAFGKIREAVSILDRREEVEFEYEGEMNVDVALNPNMRELYPFSRLTEAANVLVMPGVTLIPRLRRVCWRPPAAAGDRAGADGPCEADSDRAAGWRGVG